MSKFTKFKEPAKLAMCIRISKEDQVEQSEFINKQLIPHHELMMMLMIVLILLLLHGLLNHVTCVFNAISCIQ